VKDTIKVIGKAALAAFTSPEAVKLEKGLAVLVAVRIALAVGAGAGLVELIQGIAK